MINPGLKVVATGLHQTWWLSTSEIAEYLLDDQRQSLLRANSGMVDAGHLEKEGIAGNFDFDALSRMLQ